ncbi:MAG TPA: hypothetical protein VKA36_04725 [Solirubrobacterales bacterium]|nr:hypothetical protein [Solirubrobacterales bacterium]
MPRRPSLILIAAFAAAAIAATPAAANRQVVRDELRETRALKLNGRIDIRKAIAGHRGDLLEHKVVMRKRIAPKRGRERPLIALNTRGSRRSDAEYLVFGKGIFKNRKKGDPKLIGEAKLIARGRSWTYRFDAGEIPGLKRYGWSAVVTKGNAFDIAPAKRYKRHRV